MKRFILPTLFFFLCSFCLPQRSNAVLPAAALALLSSDIIGPALLTLAAAGGVATTVALQEPSTSSGSVSFNSDQLKKDVVVFTNVVQGGAEKAYGYATQAAVNIKQAYEAGLFMSEVPEFQIVVNDTFPSTYSPAALTPDAVIPYTNNNFRILTAWRSGAYYRDQDWQAAFMNNPHVVFSGDVAIYDNAYAYRLDRNQIQMVEGVPAYLSYWCQVQSTTLPPTVAAPAGPPQTLDEDQERLLLAALAAALAANTQAMVALNNLLLNHPDLIAPPPAITQGDLASLANTSTLAAKQALVDQLTGLAAANPTDTNLAAELAKAQADLAKQQAEELKEETFSPISDNAFTQPYNPGAYDIAARFTTFLNRVKSTGLFSFSADFFNSLPGGGSPIYEIEAGQYGHHTIDLSQTLTVGLAVLKTILLACFGFLSIRAVIMKR